MSEQKYESDMTRQEKRQAEKAKWKSFTFKEKGRYFWDYYKWTLVVLAGVIALIAVGVDMYGNSKESTVLSAAVINASAEGADIAPDFKEYLKDKDKNHLVSINTSLKTTDEKGTMDYASSMKITTMVSAKELDVMICDEGTYKNYSEQGAFIDLKDALDEETCEKYADQMVGDALCVDQGQVLEKYSVIAYDKVYIAIMNNSSHMDTAKEFIEFILK